MRLKKVNAQLDRAWWAGCHDAIALKPLPLHPSTAVEGIHRKLRKMAGRQYRDGHRCGTESLATMWNQIEGGIPLFQPGITEV